MKKNQLSHEIIAKYHLSEEEIQLVQKVHKEHELFKAMLVKTAEKAFEIGQLLVDIRERDPARPWHETVKELFPFSITTAANYIKTYLRFQENPKALVGLSKTESYTQANLKCLAEPKPEKVSGRLQAATVEEELQYDIEQLFKMPCISKARLENYRIEIAAKDGRIWMIDRSGCSMPVAELYATPPQGFPETEYKELFRDVQIALERYFEKIERYEKQGIIQPIYQG